MLLGPTLRDEAFKSARRRVVTLWRPMAKWTLLVWAVLAAIIVPLTTALIGRHILGAEQVWGNEDLARWLISPRGIVYALLTGSIALSATVVRFAGLFRIVTDDLEDRPPSVTDTIKGLVPQIPDLFRVTMFTVVAAGVLLVPLMVGLWGVYAAFLTSYDINYYLELRPRAVYYALGLAGAWAAIWALGAGYVAARFVPALPAYLDGYRPLPHAIRRGWERTRDSAPRLVRLLAVSIGLWLTARAIAAATFFMAAQVIVEALAAVADSLILMVLATGAYTAGTIILDAVISFAGFSLVSAVLTKFYYEDTDLHERVPRLPGLGTLSRRAAQRVVLWLERGRVAAVAGMVLLAGILATVALVEPPPPPGRVTVIAHRAGMHLAPENTLLALERAVAGGAEWVEIDVQRTADSVLVVVHDADLMRVAGRAQRVQGAKAAAIVGVPLGFEAGVPPEELALSTLGDFLDRARGRVRLLIELKYYGRDAVLAPLVVRAVRRAGMTNEVAYMTLDVGAVRELSALAPESPVGYLSAASVGNLTRLPVAFVAVAHQRLSSGLIRAAHTQGKLVYVWTLNDPGPIVSAVDLGADGIITDNPRVARAVLADLSELAPAGRLLLRFRNLVVDLEEGPADVAQ